MEVLRRFLPRRRRDQYQFELLKSCSAHEFQPRCRQGQSLPRYFSHHERLATPESFSRTITSKVRETCYFDLQYIAIILLNFNQKYTLNCACHFRQKLLTFPYPVLLKQAARGVCNLIPWTSCKKMRLQNLECVPEHTLTHLSGRFQEVFIEMASASTGHNGQFSLIIRITEGGA